MKTHQLKPRKSRKRSAARTPMSDEEYEQMVHKTELRSSLAHELGHYIVALHYGGDASIHVWLPKLTQVVKVLRCDDKIPKAPNNERKIVADIISYGGSIRTAALKLGISKDKARRAVKKMRPFLRDEFEMD